MMNDPYCPMKKPNGCWKWSGCMLTIVSALMIAFFVWMIVDSEREMDKSRQEFSASQMEYEEALKAYEADSVHLMAEYRRIQTEIEIAEKRHKSTKKIKALQDSLKYYDKPEFQPRGHIGVNIGAAFFVVFILILLIPLGIGLLMLLYYWLKYRKWRNNELFPK
jgi:Flp pilus assembly protein TadB